MNVPHLAAWAVILGIDNSGGSGEDPATTAYSVARTDAFVPGAAAGEGFEIGAFVGSAYEQGATVGEGC